MSNKFIRSFAIAVAFAAGVSSVNYVSPTPVAEAAETVQTKAVATSSYSAEVIEYFNKLNAVRKASGGIELKLDPIFSKAAQNHADYIAKNGTGDAHEQIAGKPLFTGVTPTDRFIAAGGNANDYDGLYEGLARASSLSLAFSNLLESTAHRDGLLYGLGDTVGVGINGNNIVFLLAANSTNGYGTFDSVKYPYNGQTDVDVAFDLVNVSQNPLKKYGVSKAGYIVSFAPYSSQYGSTYNIELYDSKNTRVPTLNPANKADGYDAYFYIIPKNELKAGEKYTAKATWVDEDGKPQTETWSFTTAGKSTTDTQKPVQPPTTGKIDVSKFADYNANQYWAGDFQWAVDKGIISGYQNVKNPSTGKYENLLKPYTNLTENQMLSVLFRYFKPTELTTTQAKTSWYGDVNYQLATKYSLPVLGANSTATKKAYAGKEITRGNFARILASMHYGKPVSQATAIQFLRTNGLTTQMTDAEFKPSSPLTRAHAVAFFHRYEQKFN